MLMECFDCQDAYRPLKALEEVGRERDNVTLALYHIAMDCVGVSIPWSCRETRAWRHARGTVEDLDGAKILGVGRVATERRKLNWDVLRRALDHTLV